MDKPFLIVGHGLAGCVLALTFLQRNIPFRIAGIPIEGEASIASSGLITPVTGRKYVKSWMIDEFIDEALQFYNWTERLLGKRYFFPVEIIRFLSNPVALESWLKRKEDPEYIRYISNKQYEILDRLEKPYGIVTGGFKLEASQWLTDVRAFLKSKNLLVEKRIDDQHTNEVFSKIIFATGAVGTFVSNGLIPNKGEAIIVRMPDYKFPGIIKEDVYFIPLKEKDTYWVGSYYQPWPESPATSKAGKSLIIKAIENVYKGSFTIINHVSGIRPTVADRRPLIGPYPDSTSKYMFNGMGTKGTSLAPYWAKHLISHFVDGTDLMRIVHPSRYEDQQSG